jgi:E3 ubiquitin-protein ligase listerin
MRAELRASGRAVVVVVQVSLRNKLAIADKTLRKWLLSIESFLRNQNCTLADAIHMWKSSVDHEFEGLEPCVICYAVIQPTHRTMPKLKCKTCRQPFHSICLFKWFKSSNKSTCPHCQAPW